MGADDCIFCKIAAGEVPSTKIYEDDNVLCFLDIGPVSDGHTLVIPKGHFERLPDCPGEILTEVMACVSKVAKAVAASTDCDGYNVLCNNGRAAGQLVGHLHFHIIPRRDGDGVFDHWPAKKYPEGKADEIAQKIRESL